ncbi:MAG: hypothetical protein Q8K58_00465 [Acidimicrobiales bacterium]|nr:hypothetical protein [Acidimicrobiales bacterium]
MFPQDSAPEPDADGIKFYDRAGVHQFLEQAEVHRAQLEAALAAAHDRRRRAEEALTAAAEQSHRMAMALRSATRDLESERDTTERTVAVILAAADAECEGILAAARAWAAEIVATLSSDASYEPVAPIRDDRPVEETWFDARLVG